MDDIFVDLRAAGLPTPSSSQGRKDLAKQIGFSDKHLDNVMSARKPYGGRLRETIRALISAKGNGPAEPDPVFAPVIERADPLKRKPLSPREMYEVIPVADGYAVVQNFVAVFRGRSWAQEYADSLNEKESR